MRHPIRHGLWVVTVCLLAALNDAALMAQCGLALSSFSPALTATGKNTTINVVGSNFAPADVLFWVAQGASPQPLATNVSDQNHASATVPGNLLTKPGTAQIFMGRPNCTSGPLTVVVTDQPNTPPVFVSPPTPPVGTIFTVDVGQLLTFTVRATDPDSGDVVTLGINGLPSGATFPIPPSANPVFGTFSWTPSSTQVGIHLLTFTATDNHGAGLSRNVTVQVPACSKITLEKSGFPKTGVVGSRFLDPSAPAPYADVYVSGAGNTGQHFDFTITGSFPDGLTTSTPFTSTLIISGIPTTAGTFTFTVTAKDAKGCTVSQIFTITIDPIPSSAQAGLLFLPTLLGEQSTTDEPVVTPTGEYVDTTIDLQLGSLLPLGFGRHYGGLVGTSAEFFRFYGANDSPMGANWVHNFLILLNRIDANNAAVYYYQGKVIYFRKSGSAWTMAQPGIAYRGTPYQLIEAGAKLKMMDPETNIVFSFDTSGMTDGTVRGVETISDRNGNTHTLAYNADGTLAKVSDGLGRSLEFTYASSAGKPRISKVADQTGRSIQFDYSDAQLTRYTDARGKVTTYAANSSSLIESITHPGGNTPVRNTYNSGSPNVVTQADGLGNLTKFAYNADNTVMTDALGNTRTHFFNSELRFIKFTDEAGKNIQFGYDDSHRKISTSDRLGDSNSITYDAASGKVSALADYTGKSWKYSFSPQAQDGFTFYNLTRIDYPDIATTKVSFALTRDELAYDAKGNLVSQTDRAGKIWTSTYNEQGQILTATNPDSGVTTYTYNADATPASVKDPAGNVTAFGYDSLKRPNRITRPDGTTVQYGYDANDNVLSRINEKGKTTAYSYDDNNQLKTITNPLGKTWTLAYDANENLTAITDPLGKTKTFTYDALQQIKSVTDRNGNAASYNYDARGRLASVVDPAGKTWSYTYDDENILTSVTNPVGQTWRTTSDKQGRLSTLTDPLSNQTRFEYNALSRLISQTNPLSETTTYGYEARGLLSQALQPGPITAAYTRNNLGLITQSSDPRGKIRSRSYDNFGRLISRTDPLGNVTRFAYDQRNRLSRIDLPLGVLNLTRDPSGLVTAGNYSDGTRLDYSYDDNDRLTSATGFALGYDGNNRIISTNGISLTRDSEGRISTMTLAAGKTVSYGYDNRNLVTSVTDWAGGTTRFSYDDAGRLLTTARPNGVVTTYSYDNAGRLAGMVEARGQTILSSITLTKDGAGQTKQATRNVPLAPVVGKENPNRTYNDADQIVGFSYDALGRLTNDGARAYVWDLASRLASFSDGQSSVSSTYDAFGNRLTRATELRPPGSGQGATRSFVWNYALALPSISLVKEGGNTIRYYIHTPGGALLYSMEEAGNARRFYHYDEIGSTLFLTDDNGAVSDTYAYSPYGQVSASSGSSDNPFTYIGKYGVMAEASTGLYYMRARYYDGATGRFLSGDPASASVSDPKSLNPYQYVSQNPMRYIDPVGLQLTKSDEQGLALLWLAPLSEILEAVGSRPQEAVGSRHVGLVQGGSCGGVGVCYGGGICDDDADCKSGSSACNVHANRCVECLKGTDVFPGGKYLCGGFDDSGRLISQTPDTPRAFDLARFTVSDVGPLTLSRGTPRPSAPGPATGLSRVNAYHNSMAELVDDVRTYYDFLRAWEAHEAVRRWQGDFSPAQRPSESDLHKKWAGR